MDGEIKRGEVYWVSFDDAVGSEMRTGRPVVVISADGKNAKSGTIICAYISSAVYDGYNPSRVRVDYGEGQKFVLCDQVRTVDKTRLDKYVGVVPGADMKRVNGALSVSMAIPYTPGDAPVAPKSNEDTTALRVELDAIKKQYDYVLNELVKMKVNADVSRLMSAPRAEACTAEESAPPKKKYEVDPTPERIEINTCTAEELKNAGCNDYLIQSIISHRPYKSMGDLRGIPGLTSFGYKLLETKACCVPIVEKPKFRMTPAPNKVEEKTKVNLNTASHDEMVRAGIGGETVARIIDYRSTKGPFKSVKEFLKVKYVGQALYDKYAPLLEV